MSDPNEMIWADNERLPGQRIYIQRSALATLGAGGWVEGEPPPVEYVPTPGDLVEEPAEDEPPELELPEQEAPADETPSEEESE